MPYYDAGQDIGTTLLGFAGTVLQLNQRAMELEQRERIQQETFALERARFRAVLQRQAEDLKLAKSRETRLSQQFTEEKRQWDAQLAERARGRAQQLRLRGFRETEAGEIEPIPVEELSEAERAQLQSEQAGARLARIRSLASIYEALQPRRDGGMTPEAQLGLMTAPGAEVRKWRPTATGLIVDEAGQPVDVNRVPETERGQLAGAVEQMLLGELRSALRGGGLEAAVTQEAAPTKSAATRRGEIADELTILQRELTVLQQNLRATQDAAARREFQTKITNIQTRIQQLVQEGLSLPEETS